MNHPSSHWRRTADIFDRQAVQYDRWFEEGPLFAIELQALRDLRTPLASPSCEVGVGSGRFAQALGIPLGLDPAPAPLRLAAGRGIAVCRGLAEALPFRPGSLSTIYLLLTLCFLAEPQIALAQCREALRPGGHLVIGMIPATSPWGQLLAAKKAQGHPFYRYATCQTVPAAQKALRNHGFTLTESRSTLYQAPEGRLAMEPSRAALDAEAGFVVLVGRKEPSAEKER